jgi:deoxycytidine triphosphate deaminase
MRRFLLTVQAQAVVSHDSPTSIGGGSTMAHMITGEELCNATRDSGFIEHGSVKCAEGVKYDFRLGGRILKAAFKRPVNYEGLTETDKARMVVEPGEVVFVLTEERLNLPNDIVALLSTKRKLSHAGIQVLGGFCVDPGYSGRLLFGLLNLSSTAFPLMPGKKLIAAMFYRLTESERGNFAAPEAGTDDFPDELVRLIQKYSPVSVASLAETVETVKTELQNLRAEIRSHEEWYNRFKESLDKHDTQIDKLLKGLEVETEARKSGQTELSTGIQNINQVLSFLRGMAWVIVGMLGIGSALLIAWIIWLSQK